ncbi:hypothetical protein [Bradyrhizobium sp. BR 1432]|uniref:hypothetical protein n=1 Tax=Bradyrhizobium sp. BR 1432 TaxID=3447966 RepID=UPI003EE5977D
MQQVFFCAHASRMSDAMMSVASRAIASRRRFADSEVATFGNEKIFMLNGANARLSVCKPPFCANRAPPIRPPHHRRSG